MIPNFPILWKQWTGSQGVEIIKAIEKYIKQTLGESIDYFSRFNLDTCDDQHLNLFGTIMGVPRPRIAISSVAEYLYRWTIDIIRDARTAGMAPGITQHEWANDGGVLAFAPPDPTQIYEDLDSPRYRLLLQTVSRSKGDFGSMILLDDLFSAFIGGSDWDIQPDDVNPGDWTVFTIPNFQNIVLMQGILDRIYDPAPRVWVRAYLEN